jgi:hypothetical protein
MQADRGAGEMSTPKPETDLRTRSAPLDMDPEEFRKLGHRLVDEIATFLGNLATGPVNRDAAPTEIRTLLPKGSLPESGISPEQLLEEVTPMLFEHSLFNGHPRFMGYITSSAAPLGALADLLAATINPNLGGWQLSPVATEIERGSARVRAGCWSTLPRRPTPGCKRPPICLATVPTASAGSR